MMGSTEELEQRIEKVNSNKFAAGFTHAMPCLGPPWLRFSAKDPLYVLGKGYSTIGALVTRLCHYIGSSKIGTS
jgi:hypothetical protein